MRENQRPGRPARQRPEDRRPDHREERPCGMQREDIVIGRNGVIELLRSGRPVEQILIVGGESHGSIGRIKAMARDQEIPVKEVSPAKLDAMCARQNHQGVIAVTGAAHYSTMEDVYKRADGKPLFVIIADGITDPHNLGGDHPHRRDCRRSRHPDPQTGRCWADGVGGQDQRRCGGAPAGGAGAQSGRRRGPAQKRGRMGVRHRYGGPVLV